MNIRHKFYQKQFDKLSQDRIEKVQNEMFSNIEQLKVKMIGYLSALNDGVIAIFITVMMLEIPYPTSNQDYHTFLWSVAVFLISFFIIADFWYNNKRIFQTIQEADHTVVVADFLFLASLALIPVTTKWIMNGVDRYATVHFGIVYFITILMHQYLFFSGMRKLFDNNMGLFLRVIFTHTGIILAVDALLILVGWFYPRQATILFIALPIINFFMPDRRSKKS